MNIGHNIKKYRKRACITQVQLAEKVNKSVSTIQKYELNTVKPNITIITKIADVLNCTVNDLLGLNITDDKDASELLYNDNQNRLINILKIYGYKIYETDSIFRIVKHDIIKEFSEEQFNNAESFINQCINFIVNR